jgi:hypothetical protein
VPEKPSEMPSLEEVSCKVDETINHMHELEDRLKELLDNENNARGINWAGLFIC